MREAFELWLRGKMPDLPPETFKWNPKIPGYENVATDWSYKIWEAGSVWGHKVSVAPKKEGEV